MEENVVVTANLLTGTATGDGTDTLLAIEDLYGSTYNDNLMDDALSNRLFGGFLGNDSLSGATATTTCTATRATTASTGAQVGITATVARA